MESNILVSIIVPVYNAEEYVSKCFEGLKGQTYSNIEIILIDDGSKDSSYDLCNDFQSHDNRVIVVHKENEGQAVARNLGASMAKGEYILFVDCDDIVDKTQVEKLLAIALKTNADIVNSAYIKFFEENRIPEVNSDSRVTIYNREDALEQLLYQRVFTQGPCCKLIRKEIVVSNPFPKGVVYEDMATVYRWFHSSSVIVDLNEVLYFYRQRKGSTMRTSFSSRKFDRITVTSAMKGFIEENYPKLTIAMNSRWLLSNMQVLMELPWSEEYKTKRREIFGAVKESRKVTIKDKKAKMSLRAMAAFTYPGVAFTMLMGRLYNRLVNR